MGVGVNVGVAVLAQVNSGSLARATANRSVAQKRGSTPNRSSPDRATWTEALRITDL
jgi:hypothetical protein